MSVGTYTECEEAVPIIYELSLFPRRVQRGSGKKGSLRIKLERAALLHIRDFECDVAALANAKRDSARNPRSAAFDYVSCVKLKYERTRMKNTTFVRRSAIKTNAAPFLSLRCAIQFHLYVFTSVVARSRHSPRGSLKILRYIGRLLRAYGVSDV